MPVLNRISHFQNRRDEVPNQELARDLAAGKNRAGIREIAENLWHANKNIQSDCLKVLYEIGYIDPTLIADYADDFLKLLKIKHNRLVWGGMIALSTIAALRAKVLFEHVEDIQRAMESGSVITRDSGVKVLAAVAASDDARRKKVFPFLLQHLASCRPKDVSQHAESIVIAANAGNKAAFAKVLDKRMTDLSKSQAMRVKKVLKEAERRSGDG